MLESWCKFELSSCPAICRELDTRPVMVNECDPNQLTYGCLCGNGQQPDIEQYSLTMPYFTCTEFGNQCVAKCGRDDHTCQSACRSENPCGAQNPKPPNSTATASATASSSTSSTDDGNTVFEGLAGDSKKPSAASVLEMGRGYGLAVVLGGLFAGFAML
jgi:hypothetical protein